MLNNIVCKFGGTSLANFENMMQVKSIVKNEKPRFVVVSAPGKRYKEDTKITDCLISCFEASKSSKNFSNQFNFLKTRFEEIKQKFDLNLDLNKYYTELEKSLKKHNDYDYVVSRGEFFSAVIMAQVLGYNFLDASSFVVFNKTGNVDLIVSKQKFSALTKKNCCYVIPGFYGCSYNGKIKTFSRGGSDITGAIVAVLAGCKVYENWTDVDGFLQADPKICKNPNLIEQLTYHELRELSYMGANVLHPDCVRFLRENNIVLNLKNTFNPTCKGSFIMPDKTKILHKGLTGIAGQKGFTIIHIEKFSINESLGIIEKISNIFKKYLISIEHIPTGIDSVSVIVKSMFINSSNKEDLIKDIKTQISPDALQFVENVSLISVVGIKLKEDKDLENKIFQSFFKSNSKILTLNKGASGLSIIFGVQEKDFDKTMDTMYNLLFKN